MFDPAILKDLPDMRIRTIDRTIHQYWPDEESRSTGIPPCTDEEITITYNIAICTSDPLFASFFQSLGYDRVNWTMREGFITLTLSKTLQESQEEIPAARFSIGQLIADKRDLDKSGVIDNIGIIRERGEFLCYSYTLKGIQKTILEPFAVLIEASQ